MKYSVTTIAVRMTHLQRFIRVSEETYFLLQLTNTPERSSFSTVHLSPSAASAESRDFITPRKMEFTERLLYFLSVLTRAPGGASVEGRKAPEPTCRAEK